MQSNKRKKLVYDGAAGVYPYKRMVQAKLFMDTHFAEDIALHHIAVEACFSRFHFMRLFKAIYGKTPHQYLTAVRIENAKILLQQGYSVTDTCYSVGYDSVSSFTGLFKKNTNQSPALFQQHHFKKQQQISGAPLRFVPSCFSRQNGWLQKSNFEEEGMIVQAGSLPCKSNKS